MFEVFLQFHFITKLASDLFFYTESQENSFRTQVMFIFFLFCEKIDS